MSKIEQLIEKQLSEATPDALTGDLLKDVSNVRDRLIQGSVNLLSLTSTTKREDKKLSGFLKSARDHVEKGISEINKVGKILLSTKKQK